MYRLFCPKGVFLRFAFLSMYSVLIHVQNLHTFTYKETLLNTLLLLVSKIVESLQCVLKPRLKEHPYYRAVFISYFQYWYRYSGHLDGYLDIS